MVKKSDKKVIMLSIHPQYATAIIEGFKKVEFRRNGVPENVSHIVIYATYPVKKIIGYCEISDCVASTPKSLWKMYGSVGGISKRNFEQYYKGYEEGKCYIIKKAVAFEKAVSFEDFGKIKTAPQSFIYVDKEAFARIK